MFAWLIDAKRLAGVADDVAFDDDGSSGAHPGMGGVELLGPEPHPYLDLEPSTDRLDDHRAGRVARNVSHLDDRAGQLR